MKDKCEWKVEKFEACDKFDGNVIDYNLTNNSKMYKCFHCKADIRKPEPAEPLIVKSGETWVTSVTENGETIDYLYCAESLNWSIDQAETSFSNFTRGHFIQEGWKSFTGPDPDITELTSEISRLWPMVSAGAEIGMLLFIIQDQGSVWILKDDKDNALIHSSRMWKLATVKELQEVNPE